MFGRGGQASPTSIAPRPSTMTTAPRTPDPTTAAPPGKPVDSLQPERCQERHGQLDEERESKHIAHVTVAGIIRREQRVGRESPLQCSRGPIDISSASQGQPTRNSTNRRWRRMHNPHTPPTAAKTIFSVPGDNGQTACSSLRGRGGSGATGDRAWSSSPQAPRTTAGSSRAEWSTACCRAAMICGTTTGRATRRASTIATPQHCQNRFVRNCRPHQNGAHTAATCSASDRSSSRASTCS